MAKNIPATDQEQGTFDLDQLTWLDSKDAAKYLRKTANALRIMVFPPTMNLNSLACS